MFCFGTIPSDLIRLTMVLPLGRNAWLDLLGEGVTILLDENKIILIHKPEFWSREDEKRIRLGFGSNFENRVAYKYLFD